MDAVPVWVLSGKRHGDNQQLVAMATALGRPFRTIPLRFNVTAGLPPALLRSARTSWSSPQPLQPPWPDLVLAAGRRSVSAALWIKRKSGGRTRLVHINRPWSPLAWFDLVVTTPQYHLPARSNVQANLLPFLPLGIDGANPLASNPAGQPPSGLALGASLLPRPWTVVMVGGDSRPLQLDHAAAVRLAALIDERLHESGGSAWILASPRTPAFAMTLLDERVTMPHRSVRWGEPHNPYASLRQLADRFIVTSDSASMMAETLLTGRPVTPVPLSMRPDWRWRFAASWRGRAERSPDSLAGRAFRAAIDLGLVSSIRDLARLQQALEAAGVFDDATRARALATQERAMTLARIEALLAG